MIDEFGSGAREADPLAAHSIFDRRIESAWPYLWLDATYLKVRGTATWSRSRQKLRTILMAMDCFSPAIKCIGNKLC
jgi:hypothetical protein